MLPENVGAWAGRANFISAKWNIYSEYAYKINDPNNKNGFIYKNGQGLLVNATYSTKGWASVPRAHLRQHVLPKRPYRAHPIRPEHQLPAAAHETAYLQPAGRCIRMRRNPTAR